MNKFPLHYEESLIANGTAESIFAYLDDHRRLSSHMNKSSWMMGGGRMETSVDEGRGQKIGSHIRLEGTAFGIRISLDEVVTHYKPPYEKIWETVGTPKLIIIGSYQMGILISPLQGKSSVKVFLDYDLPERKKWLGRLFGRIYAKWCVREMLKGVKNEFK